MGSVSLLLTLTLLSVAATTTAAQEEDASATPIPFGFVDPDVLREVRELLSTLPELEWGWLEGLPHEDGVYYLSGEPYGESVARQIFDARPGMKSDFPLDVKERIIELQPDSANALLSIMSDRNDELGRRAKNVLPVVWDSLSAGQITTFLEHYIEAYVEARPRYRKGAKSFVGTGYRFICLWPSKKRSVFNTTYQKYLDGIAYGEEGSYPGPMASTGGIPVADLSFGKHVVRIEARFEFEYEGKTYTGISDSGEVEFEIVQSFSPNKLARSRDPALVAEFEAMVRIQETRPKAYESEEVAEVVAWGPQHYWEDAEGRLVGLHMPEYEHAPLSLDLCFEVQFEIEGSDETHKGSPLIRRKETQATGWFGFQAQNAGPRRFARGREGFVPLRIVLTPSYEKAMSYGFIEDYYDEVVTTEVLRARVFRTRNDDYKGLESELAAMYRELEESGEAGERALRSVQGAIFARSPNYSPRRGVFIHAPRLSSIRGLFRAFRGVRGGSSRALPFLVKLLEAPNEFPTALVAQTAQEALAAVGDHAVEPLAQALSSPNAHTRECAARALAEMRTVMAMDALMKAATHEDDTIKQIAAKAEEIAAELEQVVEIPDPLLNAVIRSAAKVPDGPIRRADLEGKGLRKLRIDPRNVRNGRNLSPLVSLEGLQACTDLVELWIGDGEVTDLGPLRKLGKLTKLHVGRTHVEDYSPLLGLERLVELSIVGNPGIDLSVVAELPRLLELELKGDRIRDLAPLASLTNLRKLSVANNHVVDLSPLSALAELGSLDVGSNQIRDLSPLTKLPRLWRLTADRNRIRDIRPCARMKSLAALDLSSNPFMDIEALSEVQGLTSLNLAGTRVVDLGPLAGLSQLRVLNVSHTPLTDLGPLAGLTRLERLDVSRTSAVSAKPLAGLTRLTSLTMFDTGISDIGPLARLTRVQTLLAKNLGIEDISVLQSFKELTYLDLEGNKIRVIPALPPLPRIRDIDLRNNRITDISGLSGLGAFSYLRLSGNRISNVQPLMGIAEIKQGNFVDLVNNPLSCDSIHSVIPALESRGAHVAAWAFCVESIQPNRAPAGSSVRVEIHIDGYPRDAMLRDYVEGRHENLPTIRAPSAISLENEDRAPIKAEAIEVVSDDVLACTFSLAGAAVGAWDVVINGRPMQWKGTLVDGFTVH